LPPPLDSILFTSTDGSLARRIWARVKAHTDEVLALTISGDDKYLTSAGKDWRILLWNIEKNEWVKGFGGHKDTISASHSHLWGVGHCSAWQGTRLSAIFLKDNSTQIAI
jgi:WD40 repeat protein